MRQEHSKSTFDGLRARAAGLDDREEDRPAGATWIATKGKALAIPMLLYLCLFSCLLHLGSAWFSYKVFLSIGPVRIPPDARLSFYAQWAAILLAGFGGARNLLRYDGPGFVEAFFSAAVSTEAAIGIYLSCYTLHNAIFKTMFLLALAAIITFALLSRQDAKDIGQAWSLPKRLSRPLWLLMFVAGLVTSLLPGWALTAESYSLQAPADKGCRTLAANIDTAAKFFTQEWDKEDLAEKARDAGSITIVEANYLGASPPGEIIVSACPGETMASYEARENKIVLNTAYLATEAGTECIESIAHETVHAFEWQACRGLISSDVETGIFGGFPDEDTLKKWDREMSCYVAASVDAEHYFDQEIEQMAYLGGWAAVAEIQSRVEKYQETGDPEP